MYYQISKDYNDNFKKIQKILNHFYQSQENLQDFKRFHAISKFKDILTDFRHI